MNYGSIPEELKALPQWVGFMLVHNEKKGKPDKIPINPATLWGASSQNSDTWGTFEAAKAVIGRDGRCKRKNESGERVTVTAPVCGVGFVFHRRYAGVDFDHCINPDTGEVDAWAAQWVERFGSYTEISPSGTGLHIICKGMLERAVKRPEAEVYDRGRYFTVTGDVFGPERPVREAQEAIDALCRELQEEEKPKRAPTEGLVALADAQLIEIAGKAKNGAKFTDLFNGRWESRYKSQSEADMALCELLAFYTGRDEAQMDRLFRASGLMREKWDEKHGAHTYGETTLQKAIGRCKDVYQGKMKAAPAGTEDSSAPAIGAHEGERLTIPICEMALSDLQIRLRYNVLLKQAEIDGLPACYSKENAVNILPVYLMDYLKTSDIKGVTQAAVDGCLNCLADRNRYNPVQEMLDSGTWDGRDRLPEIYRILGVTDSKYKSYIRKWLIQCIALVLNDEEHPIGAEGVLVLQGEQGLAKTSFFRILSIFPRWFVEGAVIDLKDKDSLIKALGGFICELGELDSTLKREQSALKAFITNPEDRIRVPYARNPTRAPRRTSFCGTVNPKDYLRDETGSRRFWTVPVTEIDKKALFALKREWIQQLWFQVYAVYQVDHNGFRLSPEEMKTLQEDNQEFSIPMKYETEIRELLDYSLPFSQWEWWRAGEVAKRIGANDALGVGKALAKVLNDLPPSSPTSPKTIRKYQGVWERFIPLKHWGGERWR